MVAVDSASQRWTDSHRLPPTPRSTSLTRRERYRLPQHPTSLAFLPLSPKLPLVALHLGRSQPAGDKQPQNTPLGVTVPSKELAKG